MTIDQKRVLGGLAVFVGFAVALFAGIRYANKTADRLR